MITFIKDSKTAHQYTGRSKKSTMLKTKASEREKGEKQKKKRQNSNLEYKPKVFLG